jgi:superkiller protein 3
MTRSNSTLRNGLLFCLCSLIAVGATMDAARAAVQPPTQTAHDNRAGQLVSEAIAALERGDEATAKESFERALVIEPNNVTAHTYLGVLADRAGNLKEAERHFAAAAIAAPLLPSARNNHGAILIKLGRTQQAVKQFEASLRLDKNQPSALFNLAQIRFSEGTPESLRAARSLFEQAYALAPDAEMARALTIVALREVDRDAATRFYQQYTAQLTHASVESLPKPAARAELGGALLEAGLTKEAVAELTPAVLADPSNAAAIVWLARAFLSLKDIPAAGRTLEAAVARGLESAPIYALLADVYQQSGHIENAIPAMRLAIQSDPQSESYRFKYGMLLTNALAPAAAIIRLEEALKLFPRSPRLWFALGVAQFKQSRNDEAAKAFQRALEFDMKFAPALAYLGLTFEELGQYDEALKLYDQSLVVDEKMAVASYLAATALLKQNSVDLARVKTYLARAIELDASFAEARLALAKVFIRENRFAEAVGELERVAKLAPDFAETYYHLGRLYVRLKRQAEAQAAIATFKRLSELQKEQTQSERREIVRRLANVNF